MGTRKVLVTGGGSGMGLAGAEALLRAGGRGAVTGRRVDRLEAVVPCDGPTTRYSHPQSVSRMLQLRGQRGVPRPEVSRMIDSNLKNLILGNNERSWRRQYQSDTTTERVWQKLSPAMVVDLLDGARYIPRYDVTRDFTGGELLRRMKESRWCITGAPHEGGTGGQGRSADENLHITLRIAGTQYHLRCKEHPMLHIIQITR